MKLFYTLRLDSRLIEIILRVIYTDIAVLVSRNVYYICIG